MLVYGVMIMCMSIFKRDYIESSDGYLMLPIQKGCVTTYYPLLRKKITGVYSKAPWRMVAVRLIGFKLYYAFGADLSSPNVKKQWEPWGLELITRRSNRDFFKKTGIKL